MIQNSKIKIVTFIILIITIIAICLICVNKSADSISVKKMGEFEIIQCLYDEDIDDEDGIIIVDTSVISLESTAYLEFSDGTIKECKARGIGGAVKEKQIILCLNSKEMTPTDLTKKVKVYIEK